MASDLLCHSCGKELEARLPPIGRADECEHCAADIRCCFQCTFYDRDSYNECREPSSERVVNKSKANFCDYFSLSSGKGEVKDDDKTRNALDDLFK